VWCAARASFFDTNALKEDFFSMKSLFSQITIYGSDPAAGSPTATLLRLLLPLTRKH
jgi:hypothetical protein